MYKHNIALFDVVKTTKKIKKLLNREMLIHGKYSD